MYNNIVYDVTNYNVVQKCDWFCCYRSDTSQDFKIKEFGFVDESRSKQCFGFVDESRFQD